jgi:hypothetical protein
MGVTLFHIVNFVVECLVVIIGLFEIEVRLHPIRSLLNWKASRSRLSAQNRINKLTDKLAKLRLKLTKAQQYTVVEMLNAGLTAVFLALLSIVGALVVEAPPIQAIAASPRPPSPNDLARLSIFWQRVQFFVNFPFQPNAAVWVYHVDGLIFLLLGGLTCVVSVIRLQDRSVPVIERRIRDIEKEIDSLHKKL